MDNNNNIFKFILDYFNAKKSEQKVSCKASRKAVVKKYNNFLNNYNVYNLYKIAIQSHYDFLIYYLNSNNLFCNFNNDTKICKKLINLEIKLKKIYKYQDRVSSLVIPNFNLFIFLKICD